MGMKITSNKIMLAADLLLPQKTSFKGIRMGLGASWILIKIGIFQYDVDSRLKNSN